MIIYVSIQSLPGETYSKLVSDYNKNTGNEIQLYTINYTELNSDPLAYYELKDRSRNAELILIRYMSDSGKFRNFRNYIEYASSLGRNILVVPGDLQEREAYRRYFLGTDEEYSALQSYLTIKSQQNEYAFLDWFVSRESGTQCPLPPPFVPDRCGTYKDTTTADGPNVGILFDIQSITFNDTNAVDYLIGELERNGLHSKSIYFSNMVNKSHPQYVNTEDLCKENFTTDGKTNIDLLLVCTGFSLMLNSQSDGSGIGLPEDCNYLRTMLNIPVMHLLTVRRFNEFSEGPKGLENSALFSQIVWPEVDGQIQSVPFAQNSASDCSRTVPIAERIDHVVRQATNWINLKRKQPSERKITILLYQSMDSSSDIGHAGGLDVVESVARILNVMASAGYSIGDHPRTGKELVGDLLNGVTNNLTTLSSEHIAECSPALITVREYLEKVFDGAPRFDQEGMVRSWGKPPGEIQTDSGKIVIPGKIYGNVLVSFQPPRAMGELMDKVMHDPDIVIPHQYLEFYRWLKYGFGTDAVVHMGTHGSIEWLPGKPTGMSRSCYPDLALDALPHFYPYLINDPGEGIQTKRRTEAVVIGHLNPTMGYADLSEDYSKLETYIQEYLKNRMNYSESRRNSLLSSIFAEVRNNDLLDDLNMSEDIPLEEFEKKIEVLNDYLFELREALVRTDLHILGHPPSGQHLRDAAYSIMRLRNGDVPSFETEFGTYLRPDYQQLLDAPSELFGGRLGSEIISEIRREMFGSIDFAFDSGWDYSTVRDHLETNHGPLTEGLALSLEFMCGKLVGNLLRTTDEMGNLLRGFNGEFVPPGPSGAPTRGGANILPTGRNFYTLDPESVPTESSWESGCRLADQMISKFVEDCGHYPKDIGFIMWATDNMKTNGDDIAYVLWLMGVRPVWSDKNGHVLGLEVVPLSELKRPRLDVSIRITGLFRDTFPNIVEMIDDAVNLVCDLDESEEENYLAANLRRDIEEDMAKGLPEDEARRINKIRMFGSPPGNYGVGVDVLIDSSQWNDTKDLADTYINWSCYAYGRDLYGIRMQEQFVRRFKRAEISIKNMSDRETDIFDVDDVFTYLGGLNALIRAYGDHPLYSVIGDDSDPQKARVRKLEDECSYVFRTKVLNDKFLKGLMEHGYAGCTVLENISKFMIGWDGTSASLKDWMYHRYCERFIFDRKVRDWIASENPDALQGMLTNMFESMERGFWKPTPEELESLKNELLQIEGTLEELNDSRNVATSPKSIRPLQ